MASPSPTPARHRRKNPNDERQLSFLPDAPALPLEGVAKARSRREAPSAHPRRSRASRTATLPPVARASDPETSHDAAEAVRPKRLPQVMRLLGAYAKAWRMGLTDEQACQVVDLEQGGWKRCSDLRRLGLIAPTGRTAATASGLQAQVCRITQAGQDAWAVRPSSERD